MTSILCLPRIFASRWRFVAEVWYMSPISPMGCNKTSIINNHKWIHMNAWTSGNLPQPLVQLDVAMNLLPQVPLGNCLKCWGFCRAIWKSAALKLKELPALWDSWCIVPICCRKRGIKDIWSSKLITRPILLLGPYRGGRLWGLKKLQYTAGIMVFNWSKPGTAASPGCQRLSL